MAACFVGEIAIINLQVIVLFRFHFSRLEMFSFLLYFVENQLKSADFRGSAG